MSGLSPAAHDGWIVRMKHLRAALHTAVDLVLDALEADAQEGKAPLEDRAPLAKPLRASRRGTALRMFVPTREIPAEAQEKADAILRKKGLL